MYKYKTFFLLFCCFAVLLLWRFFPISFDNNDDQIMHGISAGVFTGIASPELILSNTIVGKTLNLLFSFSHQINYYTAYLQFVLLICYIGICCLLLKDNTIKFPVASGFFLFLFLGFFSLAVIKLQFTTVALFCIATALLTLQSNFSGKYKIVFCLFFLILALLIRKDSFFVFLLFCIPIVWIQEKKQKITTGIIAVAATFFFIAALIYNNSNTRYKQQKTYKNVEALDIIAAKPVKLNEAKLKQTNFTIDDITLMQSWMLADEACLSGEKIHTLALTLKTQRNQQEIIHELKKFIADERYTLLVYIITCIALVLFYKEQRLLVLLNAIVFISIVLFLITTSRLPFRVSFPIITYLIVANVFLIIKGEKYRQIKNSILLLLFFIAVYKFYCTSKLFTMHQQNHIQFEKSLKEINEHPGSLFILSDGFPFQYMNAWKTPGTFFATSNFIITGWYACSPDYKRMLASHQLKNLTSDLKGRENVLFLTNSDALMNAYIHVMKQRYQIDCHFEVAKGFTTLSPKKLVIDN